MATVVKLLRRREPIQYNQEIVKEPSDDEVWQNYLHNDLDEELRRQRERQLNIAQQFVSEKLRKRALWAAFRSQKDGFRGWKQLVNSILFVLLSDIADGQTEVIQVVYNSEEQDQKTSAQESYFSLFYQARSGKVFVVKMPIRLLSRDAVDEIRLHCVQSIPHSKPKLRGPRRGSYMDPTPDELRYEVEPLVQRPLVEHALRGLANRAAQQNLQDFYFAQTIGLNEADPEESPELSFAYELADRQDW